MGNPEILNLGRSIELGPPAPAPVEHHALWAVYCLRDHGVKLTRDDVLRTMQVGKMRLWRATTPGEPLNAWLVDPSGYPNLRNMSDVSVVKMESFGLLLRGRVMGTERCGHATFFPQAWWCVVHQLADAAG